MSEQESVWLPVSFLHPICPELLGDNQLENFQLFPLNNIKKKNFKKKKQSAYSVGNEEKEVYLLVEVN